MGTGDARRRIAKAIARLAAAAAALGCAAWLLPATVAIAAWPARGPMRIAFLPPLRTLWIALAIAVTIVAALAYAWQARGRDLDHLARLTAPLVLLWLWLVPFLPWLADVSPALLIFAGPLRWAIAAAAVGGVVAASWSKPLRMAQPDRRLLFAAAFIVYAVMGVRSARQVGFNGDEPHYLIITHSLLADRDLDIGNNHERRDYAPFFSTTLNPDFLKRGRHGEIYSVHAPGLPALLLPAYAVGGAAGAVLLVALIAAAGSVSVFDIAARLAPAGPALATWLAVSFSIPFVPLAWQIYPEIVAAAIVARAVVLLWNPPTSARNAALAGALLAILPWLHTKFVVLLAALMVVAGIRLWPRFKLIAAILTPIGISVGLWLLSFFAMYGTFDPQAPYGSSAQQVVAANIPRGVLGLLLDQKFGLLVYSPLYLLAIAGAWLLLRRQQQRGHAFALLATAVVFVLAITRFYMWWGGSSAPARFLVPIVPLAAPLIAVAIDRLDDRFGRAAVVMLTVATLAIAAIAALSRSEGLLYSNPHGTSSLIGALQGPAPLNLLLPTFTEESLRAPLAALLPWLIAMVVALGIAAMLVRAGIVRAAFWIAVTVVLVFATVGGVAASRPSAATRAAAEAQGRLTLLHAYDPDRFHAIDASASKRITADVLAQSMRLEFRPSDDPTSRLPQWLMLPEGAFESRVWFDGDAARPGDLEIVTPDGTVLARTPGPHSNPSTSRFRMPVTAAVQPHITDPESQRALRRVDITPIAVVPRSARVLDEAVVVEPIGQGSAAGVLAYADYDAYPEGGVFWTRGTAQSTVAITKDPTATLRVVLHVGPPGARVELRVDAKRFSFDLQPDETREVPLSLPAGATHAIVSVRADRAFVPASIDMKNQDRRSLGCQLRPMLF